MTTTSTEQPKRPRGRPTLAAGEGRDTPITWRTTAARRERLAKAAARLGVPQSAALDEALDAWLDQAARAMPSRARWKASAGRRRPDDAGPAD